MSAQPAQQNEAIYYMYCISTNVLLL